MRNIFTAGFDRCSSSEQYQIVENHWHDLKEALNYAEKVCSGNERSLRRRMRELRKKAERKGVVLKQWRDEGVCQTRNPLLPAPEPTEREQDPKRAGLRTYEVRVEDLRSVDTSVFISAHSAEEAANAALELERRNELSWSSPCVDIGVTDIQDLGSYWEDETQWEVVDGELRPTEHLECERTSTATTRKRK